jgi:hypothetical protein
MTEINPPGNAAAGAELLGSGVWDLLRIESAGRVSDTSAIQAQLSLDGEGGLWWQVANSASHTVVVGSDRIDVTATLETLVRPDGVRADAEDAFRSVLSSAPTWVITAAGPSSAELRLDDRNGQVLVFRSAPAA